MNQVKLEKKLRILADAAKYDASCASSGSKRKKAPSDGFGNTQGMGICHSYTPDGRCISLLKILMTNYCIYDCKFCINRRSSSVQRARFTPEEVVYLTVEFYKRNYIEGLFLSSGIIQNPDYTMECMLSIVKDLRLKHKFNGYIHLKTIPKASNVLIEQAGTYADRLSVNIELPSVSDLEQLAPEKDSQNLEQQMTGISKKINEYKHDRKKIKSTPLFAPGGQSTQMIVGATPTADRHILKTSSRLYQNYHMRRVYYSAFSPIPDAHEKLSLKKPPLIREHRLYQADWLLRFYGFHVDEITPDSSPELDLDLDPKSMWALRNRHIFPIDINKAPKELLLRVPGVGAHSVEKIIKTRVYHRMSLHDLKKLRIAINRAKYFITTTDHTPGAHLDAHNLMQRMKSPAQQMVLL